MPVRVKGVSTKTGAQPLHPADRFVDDKKIGGGHARTFKKSGDTSATMPVMRYETKTAVVIRRDLASWQIANVSAFLAGGMAGFFPEIVGEAYRDADGRLYTPLIREPMFVYGGTGVELARTHQRAISRGLRTAIYTEPLFKTTNDIDNREAVASCPTDRLDLFGLGLHADRKTIDKVVGGLKLLD